MKKFKCRHCGQCCGPVPVTNQELAHIRAAVLSLPVAERKRLKAQERPMLTCPLLDLENKRCVVYEVRPWVCRQYGRVAGLKCRYNPHVKFKSKEEAAQDIDNYMARINKDPFGGFAGFMAMDIGWPQLEGDV